MRQIRIYTAQTLVVARELVLDNAAAEHVGRVLRLRSGDALTLFNGNGHDYAAQLTEVTRHRVCAKILDAAVVDKTSPLSLTLAQGIARGDKMDWVVQKATELGITRIVPLLTERSEVRLDAQRAEKRVEHWRAVAISACEQCGRSRLPEIEAVQPLSTWCPTATGLRLALNPQANLRVRELTLTEVLICLVVGPEGGLGKSDLAALQDSGFAGLRLGPRILRSETAGLVALAALQAAFGDL